MIRKQTLCVFLPVLLTSCAQAELENCKGKLETCHANLALARAWEIPDLPDGLVECANKEAYKIPGKPGEGFTSYQVTEIILNLKNNLKDKDACSHMLLEYYNEIKMKFNARGEENK